MELIRGIEIIFLVFLSVIVSNCGNISKKNADNSILQQSDTGTAVITFNEYEHDFGKVVSGEKVGCVFVFKNDGTGSLAIASARTTCGCTVPEYSTKPVPPGGDGTLEVIFDTSGRNGNQTKTISVRSNASTPVVVLKIVAEVVTNNN